MPPRTPAQRARQLELKIAKLRAQLAEAEAARRELPAAPPAPAELDWRAHQQNLQALIENSDGSVWSIDRHYRMIVGNTRYLENVGAALGRPLTPGEDVLALPLPPAALAEWRGYYDRALRGEQFSVEVPTRFTAQPRHVEYRFNPIRTAAGEVVGVTVFGRDVTERQQAQARLTKLAERLELAVRAAGLGIWEWDIQKNELIWDDQMYALYGVQRADFAHDYDAWLHGLHPEDRALSDTVSRQAVSGEKDYDTEFRVCWPDGQVRILQAKASVIRDAAGRPLRMIGVNVDITERRQAEDQLRASERRFRNFFELGTVGMAITSPEKGWVEYNDRLCEMLGYPREALPALTWAQLTYPEDLPADLAYFNRVAAGEIDGYALDKRFLRQDGTVLPVS
nr:PAS domain S-box protein [Anaerolineales bacterium]